MKKVLTPAQRLIVAADFKPEETSSNSGRQQAKIKVQLLCQKLKGTGVYIKVNSALRAVGYGLIDIIHGNGLLCFADLKLYDIGETLSTDGCLLRGAKPDLLTTVCGVGAKALKRLKEELPETEVLGVTVLTSLTEEEVFEIHGATIPDAALILAKYAANANLDGLIASAAEAQALREFVGDSMSINVANIRQADVAVRKDDQNPDRSRTVAQAFEVGVDRIIVGRPVTQSANPLDAVKRFIEEIAVATN